MKHKVFTFNPFSENTYLVYDEDGNGVIIDPGCMDSFERQELTRAVEENQVRIQEIILTHAHIDHIFGCAAMCETYNTGLVMHPDDQFLLDRAADTGRMYGLPVVQPPAPSRYFKHGEIYSCGSLNFKVLHTPGHSPGSVCFVNEEAGVIFGGDVLFRESIGRTDLPGGDYETLLASIRTQLFGYPDHFTVYSGHGPATTIGHEKQHNPFLR